MPTGARNAKRSPMSASPYQSLCELSREQALISTTASVLGWDQETHLRYWVDESFICSSVTDQIGDRYKQQVMFFTKFY